MECSTREIDRARRDTYKNSIDNVSFGFKEGLDSFGAINLSFIHYHLDIVFLESLGINGVVSRGGRGGRAGFGRVFGGQIRNVGDLLGSL